MIIDRLNNCDLYQGLHKDFSKVFEILKTLGDDVPAEKIVIDDGNAWVFPPCVLTDITDSKHFEAHNDFYERKPGGDYKRRRLFSVLRNDNI